MNNHQVEFTRAVAERMGNIIPVYDIEDLAQTIADYDKTAAQMAKNNLSSNNQQFNRRLEQMASELLAGKEV